LEYDSTFAQAYTGLAMVYWSKHFWRELFSEDFLDSVLILTDIALSLDDQLAEAYAVRGGYYEIIGLTEQALKEYDIAINFNPNDWMAYFRKGWLHIYDDNIKAIENLQKSVSLNRGLELPNLFVPLSWAYTVAGFTEKAKYYTQEVFQLNGDSMAYYGGLGYIEFYLGNFEKAIELLEKGYTIDSNNIKNLQYLGECYMFNGQYEESLKYFKKWIERRDTREELTFQRIHWVGYAYWKNGYKEEAEYYFNELINYYNRLDELGRGENIFSYYDLAGMSAFWGDKDKAYEHLKIYNRKKVFGLWEVFYIKNDPLFNSIRDEPEFQQIVSEIEAKYQAEHERVRKWLEDQGLL
jgi:tetratricopeptide (TPR) repeat protein